MKIINEYYPEREIRNFPEMDERIKNYYDIILDLDEKSYFTPRYMSEGGVKIAYRDSWYYISWLYDNKPQTVIDVGCGEFTFKDWFPNLIGLEPRLLPYPSNNYIKNKPDIIGSFNDEFSRTHTEQYDCGMALNSVHFVPWAELSNQIELVMNIIKLGGRFLFTMNFERLSYLTRTYDMNDPFLSKSFEEMGQYLYDIIAQSGHHILLFDCPKLRGVDYNPAITGDVRFILEKTQ